MMKKPAQVAGGTPSAVRSGPGGVLQDGAARQEPYPLPGPKSRSRGSVAQNSRRSGGQSGLSNTSNCVGRLLAPEEAAEFLGIPKGTLAQWRSQRRGPPFIKLESRLVRYRLAELEMYLERHTLGSGLDNHNG
jgi:predicted DNA-binding transcriptional regulator AlpA